MNAHLLYGLAKLKSGAFDQALDEFQKAAASPDNIATGRQGSQLLASQLDYCTGAAYEAMTQRDKARECDQRNSDRAVSPRWPAAKYYQGLSMRRLGHDEAAIKLFDEMIRSGRQKTAENESPDVFAKFGEMETLSARTARDHLSIGLGLLGKGEKSEARQELEQAVKLNASDVWARYQLGEIR